MEQYIKKMKGIPPYSVADKGYRSKKNMTMAKAIGHAFFGKSSDVDEEQQSFCRSARSATEGFIAVAKNLRGMRKSLYKRIDGDKIWTALAQTAYNLKKFYALYRDELLSELTLQKLGFIA